MMKFLPIFFFVSGTFFSPFLVICREEFLIKCRGSFMRNIEEVGEEGGIVICGGRKWIMRDLGVLYFVSLER